MSAGPVLASEGLGKRYGSHWALRDCTLEVPAGSVTALVGPNGAGKTTLLQLAVGLTRPSAGTVSVLGCSPRDDAASRAPADRLRRAGAPALPRILDRGDAPPRAQAQPALGRRCRARPRRTAGAAAAAEGGHPLGWAAGSDRADPGAREAPGAAGARRARGVARPARPPRVPPGAHGGGRRGRDDGDPLLAHRGRPRARVRPPRDPGRGPDAARGPARRDRGEPPAAHRPA